MFDENPLGKQTVELLTISPMLICATVSMARYLNYEGVAKERTYVTDHQW